MIQSLVKSAPESKLHGPYPLPLPILVDVWLPEVVAVGDVVAVRAALAPLVGIRNSFLVYHIN